jgi:DNA-binding beta-propeller fold protein YncE/Ca2+-binding RTX toxin-like protein
MLARISLFAACIALGLFFAAPASAEPPTFQFAFGSEGIGSGQFDHPADIAIDAEGNAWVVDENNYRVQKFSKAGEYLGAFGNSGFEAGEFNRPTSIAIDVEEDLWVADAGNHRVQEFDAEGKFLQSLGSSGTGNGQFSGGGPEGVAIDAEGDVWVSDTYNGRVQEFDSEGKFIQVVGSYGSGEGEIGEATGIDVAPGGDVWIADWQNNRVEVFDQKGELVRQFGSAGSGAGKFSHPDAIDVDVEGNVWVGDEGNDRVQRFDELGEYVDEFGSEGSGEGEFEFGYPFGIITDSGNHVWVADANNHRVQVWEIEKADPTPACSEGSSSTEVGQLLELVPGELKCKGEAPLAYELVSEPEDGEISEFDSETGSLTYTPDAEFKGPDSFTFRAANKHGTSSAATFYVEVGKRPKCKDIALPTEPEQPVPVQLECSGDFLEDAYEIISGPSDGEVSEFDPETGALTYTPDEEFLGLDQIVYRRSSWIHKSAATVSIAVCHPPTIGLAGEVADPEAPGVYLTVRARVGKPSCEVSQIAAIRVYIDENLTFSEQRNCWIGCFSSNMTRTVQLPYPDVIGERDYRVEVEDQFGAEAEPEEFSKKTSEEGTILDLEAEVSKEEGCDKKLKAWRKPYPMRGNVVIGTKCADIITPQKGATIYRGLGGDDRIIGGGRPDKIRGEGGSDTIIAGRGNDKMFGGAADDYLLGGAGDDYLDGELENDSLIGGAGADRIQGRDGDDLVRGGTTVDTLDGGAGENTLSFADGVTPGFRLFPEGKGGPITAFVSGFPKKHEERGVYVNLNAGSPIGDNGEAARFGGGFDRIIAGSFQNVIGTAFADLIVGSDGANVIDAGGGTDIVRSGAGDDRILGGDDQDFLDGGSDQSAGVVDGGGDADTCLNAPESVDCESEEPETELVQPEAKSLAIGLIGSEAELSPGNVYVRGTAGNDDLTASWSPGVVTVAAAGSGGRFDPEESGVAGCTIESETKAQCAVSGPDSIVIHGAAGRDLLRAQDLPKEMSVTLLGGEQGDTLIGGGATEDVLVDGTGTGDDRLRGNNGDDALFANGGKDKLNGGAGDDLFVSSVVCGGDTIHGAVGADNANWAQLVGAEIEAENEEYPQTREDHIYEDPSHGAKVRIAQGTISQQGIGCGEVGHISGVEHLEGSRGPDVLVGDDETNVLLGRAGADVLIGKGGDDRMLANNRSKKKDATPAEKKDRDKRLDCGSGDDKLKRDPADKPIVDGDCEKAPVVKGRQARVSGIASGSLSEAPPEALDEAEIGAATDPEAVSPAAFFRLDEASGTSVVNWQDQEETDPEEEGPENESEEEPEEEESKEEQEELEEEEPHNNPSEEEEADEERPGAYEGGELGEPGAFEESQAVHLDGSDDYIDLTTGWDPRDFIIYDCREVVSGYSVEMWVKLDGEASAREELFSRTEAGNGFSLFRSEDGKLNFSVFGLTEAPTVSTHGPVGDGEWHHVVATMAQKFGESCPTFASLSFFPEEEPETLETSRIVLYVDGFPYVLDLGNGNAIPGPTPNAHNIVGAREGDTSPNWLAGTVDDVAIYGEALSIGDVESHLSVSEAPQPSVFLEPPLDTFDEDEDEVPDSLDNCPEASNPEQEDEDVDGIGDACEPEFDTDEDGIADELDNCPDDVNAKQEDSDENGVGDACEPSE